MKRDGFTKINLNVSNDLLSRIDKYAELNSINRTSAICVLCSNSLEHSAAVSSMPMISELIQKLDYFENMKKGGEE